MNINKKLLPLLDLNYDWDGHKSQPIELSIIEIASELFDFISNYNKKMIFDIYAIPGGSIQLEYEYGDEYLIFEITLDGTLEYIIERNNERQKGKVINLDHVKELMELALVN